jgi:hypothetical protein
MNSLKLSRYKHEIDRTEAGAVVNYFNQCVTTLIGASNSGNEHIMEMILKRGSGVNEGSVPQTVDHVSPRLINRIKVRIKHPNYG